MNKQRMAGAVLASLSLPLLFSAISAPMANATSVSSTVATVDNCKWAFGDAPASLVMGAGAELYRGDPLRVSQKFTAPTLGLSGTTATALTGDSVECSFYNAVINSKISAELGAGLVFAATFGGNSDDLMNFAIGGTDPTNNAVINSLVLTPDITLDTSGCKAAGWQMGSPEFVAAGAQELLAFSSLTTDFYAAEAGPRCSALTEIAITIPGRTSAPAGAGSQYTFSGPVVTFAKVDF